MFSLKSKPSSASKMRLRDDLLQGHLRLHEQRIKAAQHEATPAKEASPELGALHHPRPPIGSIK